MNNLNTPYSNLNPNLILDAIESIGFQCNGVLLALNSYENRVYQIGIEESTPLIAKFYRPLRWSSEAILEEHQFSLELANQELAVVPPLCLSEKQTSLHVYEGFRFALFPRKGGRPMELGDAEQQRRMGRFIGRLHAIGACQGFMHRLRLDVQSYGYLPFQFLIENHFLPADLENSYRKTVEEVLQQVELSFRLAGPVEYIRLHGDCHVGNILWGEEGPQMVDLDDCLMGPAIQDLWMLLSGNTPDEIKGQMHRLLYGYQEFMDFNFRELYLIEALRSLRMIHYSAWLAKRWEDPTFPLNFPWFNTPRYWQEQIRDLAGQLSLLNDVNNGAAL